MRLTPRSADIIRTGVREIFGADAQVWLFGSRVDDTKRGGDIDLYIETSAEPEAIPRLEGRLFAWLQRRLGEQRIDILARSSRSPPRPAHREALRTGIRL